MSLRSFVIPLSIAVDLLAGALTTGKSSDPQDTVLRNNMLSIYIAPQVYDTDGTVSDEVSRFLRWVKASPPAFPGHPVMLPGEVECTSRAVRATQGIPIDDKTWGDLVATAESVGISGAAAGKLVGFMDPAAG